MTSSTRWTLYAGIYTFLISVTLLLPLGFIADTLLKVLGLSFGFAGLVIPSSAGIIGAVCWWGIIERRDDRRYLTGGIFGLVTALSTVLLWMSLTAFIYGPGIVLAAGVVILFSAGVTAPVGFIAGLSLMYGRRHSGFSESGGMDPIPE